MAGKEQGDGGPPPPRLPLSALSTQPPILAKRESPKQRARLYDGEDATLTEKRCCNCRHSRCLKLYCECFAFGIYCDGCNCINCCNNVENEAARREAIDAILVRNPDAFKPKIGSSPHTNRNYVGISAHLHVSEM